MKLESVELFLSLLQTEENFEFYNSKKFFVHSQFTFYLNHPHKICLMPRTISRYKISSYIQYLSYINHFPILLQENFGCSYVTISHIPNKPKNPINRCTHYKIENIFHDTLKSHCCFVQLK